MHEIKIVLQDDVYEFLERTIPDLDVDAMLNEVIPAVVYLLASIQEETDPDVVRERISLASEKFWNKSRKK